MAIKNVQLLDAEDYARIPTDKRQDYYGEMVERLIRKRYSQSQIEAIINNYLDDGENTQYKADFIELQSYRKECKARAKSTIGKL